MLLSAFLNLPTQEVKKTNIVPVTQREVSSGIRRVSEVIFSNVGSAGVDSSLL